MPLTEESFKDATYPPKTNSLASLKRWTVHDEVVEEIGKPLKHKTTESHDDLASMVKLIWQVTRRCAIVHIHDHYPTGLFRASTAQRYRPNACEGAPGSRKRSWMIPERSNQVRFFFLTWVKARPGTCINMTNSSWIVQKINSCSTVSCTSLIIYDRTGVSAIMQRL